tara:strand:- start:114 stop:2291 length:2178 start_codon:yes stop_codon:yes gene_type:complete
MGHVLWLIILVVTPFWMPVNAQEGLDVACGDAFGGKLAPSRDLYCIELTAIPGMQGVSGVVELSPLSSPFTAGVTRDGRLIYKPRITLSGLPEPSSLGEFNTFVAWAADPTMYPVIKLGEVGNGTWSLSPIYLNKFVILISAERSSDVDEREGKLVLREQSASSRMQPADVLEFMLGVRRSIPGDTLGMESDPHTTESKINTELGWTMPPMPAGISMLPAVMELRPDTDPYLPSVPNLDSLPEALPREVLDLRDGDTLNLNASLVRRDINGQSFAMYAFNGQQPGPMLRVDQGTTVTVIFTNNIDWPTMIHWHGLRLDNRFDGTPLTQDPVPPGHKFEYRIFFKDAGIYWYHPHVREDVTQDLGLYGNMRVVSSRPNFYGPAHREEIITLDDLLVGEKGLVPFGKEHATHALMGRFGNVFLVNGEPNWEVEARRGEVVRFFLTNVSNTRTYNLSFGDLPMKVVGSDVGNFEREEWVDNIVIAPAERYVVHVRFPETGRFPLVNDVQGLDHLFGSFFSESDTMGSVMVSEEDVDEDLEISFSTLREDVPTIEEIDQYRSEFARPVDYELELVMEGKDLPQVIVDLMELDSAYFAPVEWSPAMPMMNWAASPENVSWIIRDPSSGKENMDIDDWSFRVGEIVKVRLHNSRRSLHAMQHPIHIHGQRFLILTINGMPNHNLVWKDTMMLPVGATADILLELSNPGLWMLHCHIAEHLEAGMMMAFTVQ